MNEQTMTKIARRFGVKVTGIKRIRKGIFRVAAPGGKTYSLKRMPKRIARLRWIDRTLQRIRNGGSLLAWRNPRMPEGRQLCVKAPTGEPYVLTPWISGRIPSPRSLSDMRACGVALAKFHMNGRAGVQGQIPYSRIGRWHANLRSRQRKLLSMINKAKRNGFSPPINRFVQQISSEILQYSKQAGVLLRNSGYRAYSRNPRRYGVVSHGDGGPSNFILNAKGTYLIDFETVQVNLRAYDLYRIIYNSCKDHHWNFGIAKAILSGYRQVAKLSKTDYKLIQVWLRFPYSTYLALSPFDRIPLSKNSLKWALESEREIGTFLKKLNNYA
ncbi:phosphotransferase [Cohnella cholangitidis]|uniref:Phosphotransferase n=1 Tax=Cohnella cholangitidis TaxID=2598458 RepID=A0A7G5C0Z4_9BACL|nr:phosphotransferase [Cohnella cholangitidis]QMV42878.1 phosphotransferase [Cohnella cholangitidis]